MRKTVHLCLSSHDEVMYRSEADLVFGFNCLALAARATEARLLAEGFMTTHNHQLMQVDNWKDTKHIERYAYTRYFNAKYHRKGRLGEQSPFCLEIVGTYHLQAALNYVLRQGLHHGLSETPFAYPHSSVNAFFKRELGKDLTPALIAPQYQHKFLPEGKKLPAGLRMAASGRILREDVVDTVYVEQAYQSARNFLYQMNRISDDKDIKNQVEENDLPPVTLDSIESGVKEFDVKAALLNERGRVNSSHITDLEMCQIIDELYLPEYVGYDSDATIYTIHQSRREDIGNAILQDIQDVRSGFPPDRSFAKDVFSGRIASWAQIGRCLALKYGNLSVWRL